MDNIHCVRCSNGVCVEKIKNDAFSKLSFGDKKQVIEKGRCTPDLKLIQTKGKVNRLLRSNDTNSGKQDEKTIYSLEDFVVKADVDHINFRPLIEFCKRTKLAPKLHSFSLIHSQLLFQEELDKTTVKKSSFETFMENIKKKKNEESKNVKQSTDNNKACSTNTKTDMKGLLHSNDNKCKDNNLEMKEKPAFAKHKQDAQRNEVTPTEASAGTGVYQLMEFLNLLCDRSENGRVLVQKGNEQSGCLKYLLLNPTEHFADVIKQCRSVILAGGTMEPVSEFLQLLTGSTEASDRVNVVKCEHVVPKENVLALCASRGPSQLALNFSYENRMSVKLLEEVGHILRNICMIVPGGVVCFLPSYTYEEAVHDNMKRSGVLDRISKKKTIFREPKSASEVDQVLSKYASAVNNKDGTLTGALLLSVVGGKLSEGLNFSDDLGRCVLVIGMPYPNIKSPELNEKMRYLDRTIGSNAGHTYYENLCMKAVNQCIGRAVRHINDYACVLLVDERYSRQQTISALPSFVQRSLHSNCNFGSTFGNIAKFFARQKHTKMK